MSYQDALFKDYLVRGGRGCEERWSYIKPHLPSQGLILDIGSNLGYFSLRACLENQDLGAVSIEAEEETCSTQRKILRSHNFQRICLLRGMLNATVSESWRAVSNDRFDVVLLLSIVHWFDNPEKVVSALFGMTGLLIAELVDPADVGACGRERTIRMGDPIDWLRKTTGCEPQVIGRCKRHTSAVPSHLIVVRNTNASHSTKQDESSISLSTLMKLGQLIWPEPAMLTKAASQQMSELNCLASLLYDNLFWTKRGLTISRPLLDGGGVRSQQWKIGGTRETNAVLVPTDKQASCIFLARCLRAWNRAETAWANADASRETTATRTGKLIRRAARRVLPPHAVALLRGWLKQSRGTKHVT